MRAFEASLRSDAAHGTWGPSSSQCSSSGALLPHRWQRASSLLQRSTTQCAWSVAACGRSPGRHAVALPLRASRQHASPMLPLLLRPRVVLPWQGVGLAGRQRLVSVSMHVAGQAADALDPIPDAGFAEAAADAEAGSTGGNGGGHADTSRAAAAAAASALAPGAGPSPTPPPPTAGARPDSCLLSDTQGAGPSSSGNGNGRGGGTAATAALQPAAPRTPAPAPQQAPAPSPPSPFPVPPQRQQHTHHGQQQPRKLFYGSMNLLQVLGSFSYRSMLLFVIGGALLSWVVTAWSRGTNLQLHHPYTFSVTFPIAPSLDTGVPLRMKGVQVGSVIEARSGLEYVEAVVEVNQRTCRIPRSSVLVYNKAGPLSPSPFIDVQLPSDKSKAAKAAATAAAAATVAAKPGGGDVQAAHPGGASGTDTSLAATAPEGDATVEGPSPAGSAGGSDAAAGSAASGSVLSASAAAEAALSGPDDGDACRLEDVLLCAGDRVQGVQGGGMDELTALMLSSMKRGVDDVSALPPVMRQALVARLQAEAKRGGGTKAGGSEGVGVKGSARGYGASSKAARGG